MKRVGGGSWSASKKCHLIRCKTQKKTDRTSGTFSFSRPTSRPFENKESSGALVAYWLYICCVWSGCPWPKVVAKQWRKKDETAQNMFGAQWRRWFVLDILFYFKTQNANFLRWAFFSQRGCFTEFLLLHTWRLKIDIDAAQCGTLGGF